MSVFAIADLHLPGGTEKPMHIFGTHWKNHFEVVCANWENQINHNDIVLLPGDISWAMQLSDALVDLQSIANLPGEKILIKGNHDYWWNSLSRVRTMLPKTINVLQNDSLTIGDFVFLGTRGWNLPTTQVPLEPSDEKILQREVERLRLSINHAQQYSKGKHLVALMHFPPLLSDGLSTDFSILLENACVANVVYGHLHGLGTRFGFSGKHNETTYHLVSCDAISFSPVFITN